jgi:hypothetical protein
MPKKKLQMTFNSNKDALMFSELASLSGHSESSLGSLAISEWLRDNYHRMHSHYS